MRRSRRLFWDGAPAAFETLRTALVTVAQLLAPFTPFLADEIYDNLDGREPSIHLTNYPVPDAREPDLEEAMAVARQTVRLGLAARASSKLKVRQPLRAAVIVADGFERASIERFADLVRDELNVRELRFVTEADDLGEIEVKPNYRALGPRFGKDMPQVAAAVAGLDPVRVGAALRDGTAVGITVGGADHELVADDLLVSMKPLAGYQIEREGSHAVALELEHRRRAADRGLGPRDRARRPGGAARRRARRHRPDRPHARGRRRRSWARPGPIRSTSRARRSRLR